MAYLLRNFRAGLLLRQQLQKLSSSANIRTLLLGAECSGLRSTRLFSSEPKKGKIFKAWLEIIQIL